MEITVIARFGVGDIDTYEISPAVLEIVVDPERGGVVEDILLRHSTLGNFRYAAEPPLGRFQITVGQHSDLDRIEEALVEIATLEGDGVPFNFSNTYAIRDLIRELQQQREEMIVRKETDTIEDEIATGIYGDEYY